MSTENSGTSHLRRYPRGDSGRIYLRFFCKHPRDTSQDDDSFVIDGGALLRDINRALDWELPISGPKTLNGLVLEHLETIPEENLCIQINDYQIETLQLSDNMVKNLKCVRVASNSLAHKELS